MVGCALASILVGTLAACEGEAPPARQPERTFGVQVVEATPAAEQVTLTGVIAARVESTLAFRTGGRITERLVDVGDHVTAGQVLARLDPDLQQADVASAEAGVASAEAEVAQADAAFARSRSLFERGYTTRRDFEAAEQSLTVARSGEESAAAQLASAQEALSFAELRADAAGIVTERQLDVGETAQAAAPVFTVALDGPRDAVFDIYEGLLLGGGEPPQIRVALVSDPTVAVTGEIRQVAPSVDLQRATVRAKVGLDQVPASMALGAPVSGTASIASKPSIVVPAGALDSLDGRPAVWVLDPASGTVALREVEIAAYDARAVSLAAGLETGERVVVEGTKFLRPGEAVDVTEVAAVGEEAGR